MVFSGLVLILSFLVSDVQADSGGKYTCPAPSSCPYGGKSFNTLADCDAACPSGGLACFTYSTCVGSSAPTNCPTGPTSVVLPTYGAELSEFDKHLKLSFDTLTLQFTPVSNVGSSCTLQSNSGSLKVLISARSSPDQPFGTPYNFLWITSTTSATLNFYQASDVTAPPTCNFSSGTKNSCLLNGPIISSNDMLAEWKNPGFNECSLGVCVNSGPMDFWVDMTSLGLSSDISESLQPLETYIHETLIDNLPSMGGIGGTIAAFLDPPANDILVTDPDGKRTGVTSNGTGLNEIPFSAYFSDNNVTGVIIVSPKDGNYTAQITGNRTGQFSLVTDLSNFTGNFSHPLTSALITNGTIEVGEIKTYNVTLSQGNVTDLTDLSTIPEFPVASIPVLMLVFLSLISITKVDFFKKFGNS